MTNNLGPEATWLTEEQLAALVNPRSHEVFRAFRIHGPATVDEVQHLLDCPSKTIYYQVGKLVKAGLLQEAGQAKGIRRERQVYAAVKGSLLMPGGFQGARYERLAARRVTARLRSVIRDFNQSAKQSEAQPELVDDLHITAETLKLSDNQVQALTQGIEQLLAKFAAAPTKDGRAVRLTCVMTPHESRLEPG